MLGVDAEHIQRKRPAVLVVQESSAQNERLHGILSEEGFEVLELTSGKALVDTAIQQRPDVIILDLDSSGIRGLKLCESLRRTSSTQHIPVILQTAQHRDAEKIVEGLSKGAFDYLIKPYNDREFIARVGVMTRISRMLNENRHLAMTDVLTGLLNRRSLFERLREEVDRAKRYRTCISCVMIDLDHFKRVNDTYGHSGGDEVLKETGRVLAESKRLPDVVGRYGGEEFLMLLPETGAKGAEILAERVRTQISSNVVTFGKHSISVTASLGVATTAAGEVQNADQIVSRADRAMYQAKHAGRNRTILTPLSSVA